MRRRTLVVLLALLASAAPLSGQNALVQGVSADVALRLDCELTGGHGRERAVITRDARVAWCASPDFLVAEPTLFEHTVLVDGDLVGRVVSPSCAGTPLICTAPAPAETVALLAVPGQHEVAVGLARLDPASGVRSPVARSMAAQIESVTGCTYIPNGSAVEEMRPIGYAMQGFNAMAGQAQRIGDLRGWGWRVEWQLDPASQKLFLMAWCVGSPQ